MTEEERKKQEQEQERMFAPNMTVEEYERIIGSSTDATNAAQAQKNAAEASALSSAAAAAMRVRANESTGGAGGTPTYTEAERAQGQANAEAAAQQATTPISTTRQDANAASSVITGEQRGMNPVVQRALDEKQKEEAAKRVEDTIASQKSAPTTQDFHNNTPEPDEDTKYEQAIRAENEKRYQNLYNYVEEIRKRQQQDEDEMRRQEQADMWSTMGTGATELAAGIINMLGVGELNATNQVYHNYSADWMKKADQNIQEHRRRRDGMRDTLDRLNLQIQELKSGQTIQELQLARQMRKEKEAKERADRQQALQEQKYQDAVEQQKTENAFRERQIALQEQARKDARAQNAAQIQLQYDLHGFTTDPKTGRRVAPATGVTATGRGSGGGGSSSHILLSIPPTTAGEKGTRLTINSGSLIATINANVDLFKANDQKAIQRILRGTGSQDDKAKQLEQYIKTSPEILDLLKLSSLAVDEFDWGKTETKDDGSTETKGGSPTKSSQDLINEL